YNNEVLLMELNKDLTLMMNNDSSSNDDFSSNDEFSSSIDFDKNVITWTSSNDVIQVEILDDDMIIIKKLMYYLIVPYTALNEQLITILSTSANSIIDINLFVDLTQNKCLTNIFDLFTFLGYKQNYFYSSFIFYLNNTLVQTNEQHDVDLPKIRNNYFKHYTIMGHEEYDNLLLYYIKMKKILLYCEYNEYQAKIKF
ncbi:MAG: hypothetical protein O7C56_00965, partial [Rickettsia endosymbiont of Ixodes persulcatus]|nr:hypothetical protein [Rickettsia endosymbiont of Ixodes persulcatus]